MVDAITRHLQVLRLQSDLAHLELRQAEQTITIAKLKKKLAALDQHGSAPMLVDFEALYVCQHEIELEPGAPEVGELLGDGRRICAAEFHRWSFEKPTEQDKTFCNEHRPKLLAEAVEDQHIPNDAPYGRNEDGTPKKPLFEVRVPGRPSTDDAEPKPAAESLQPIPPDEIPF